MRASNIATLAAALWLAAGGAHAATWTFSGTTNDISGELPNLDQGQAYYIRFLSAAPVREHLVRIYARERVWLDPYGEIDAFNYNDDLQAPIQPWGFQGVMVTPSDHGDIVRFTFDPLKLTFGVFPVLGDDGASPWTLTISTDPFGPPTGVPEPAAWALMILGFGLAGQTLRRRPSQGRA